MAKKVLALNKDGGLTYCTAPPEERGKGRCNHVSHQKDGQSVEDFIESVNNNIAIEEETVHDSSPVDEVSQEDIDAYASRIDEIAGEKVTMENFEEVLSRLSPQQIQEITKIGFEAAPEFSLPISDENYAEQDEENNLYFATLPNYNIAGKATAIQQMFNTVGPVPSEDGMVDIKGNYRDGLSPSEYFDKQFSARSASIAKSVSVAKPGYTARKMFYALSDIEMKHDCGGPHKSVMDCRIPGGICSKCAQAENVDFAPGTLLGSELSTNLSEPGTQMSMREFHTGGKNLKQAEQRDVINKTFDAYKSSYIIREAIEAETTEEAREIIYKNLRQEYDKNGIEMDDFNIKMIAKKLTSYKRDPKVGTRYVKPNEKCDIISIGSIGNYSNPFKSAELKNAYPTLTKPGTFKMNPDAANEIIF